MFEFVLLESRRKNSTLKHMCELSAVFQCTLVRYNYKLLRTHHIDMCLVFEQTKHETKQTIFHLILGTVTLFWNLFIFSFFLKVVSHLFYFFTLVMCKRTQNAYVIWCLLFHRSFLYIYLLKYFHLNGLKQVMFMWGPRTNKTSFFFFKFRLHVQWTLFTRILHSAALHESINDCIMVCNKLSMEYRPLENIISACIQREQTTQKLDVAYDWTVVKCPLVESITFV